MKKLRLALLILAFTVGRLTPLYAGVQSQSFTIKVFLPAIAGVNVPDTNQIGTLETFTNAQDSLQILSENIMRDGQPIILKTIIAR